MADRILASSADGAAFAIRAARASDKQTVLAFCRNTFDWGDYLPEVWDEWLTDGRGPLLVATLHETPVGVAKVTLLTADEAWLQGLRVHQAYRRRGLAWQFLVHCLDAAAELGAQVARLATGSKNVAVHKTTERAGMRRVASAVSLAASALDTVEGSLELSALTAADWPQVARRILHGTVVRDMGGLYGAGWVWESLSEAKLRAHLESGQVLALPCQDRDRRAMAVIGQPHRGYGALQVAHLDAEPADGCSLALALRRHAGLRQMEPVEVMLPAASSLRQTFREAGYDLDMEGSTEIWVYEMQGLSRSLPRLG